MRKGVAFAMQVLIVVVVILIVALVVLGIFGGGIGRVSTFVSGEQQMECTSIPGGQCISGGCTPPAMMNLGGTCPTGQICCVTPQG